MRLIRIDFEHTFTVREEDGGEVIMKSIKQRSLRVVIPAYTSQDVAAHYCDTWAGNDRDPGYKRLNVVDEGTIDVILQSPLHRI